MDFLRDRAEKSGLACAQAKRLSGSVIAELQAARQKAAVSTASRVQPAELSVLGHLEENDMIEFELDWWAGSPEKSMDDDV